MPSTTYYPETKYKSRLSRPCGAADATLYVDSLPTQSTGILMIDKDSDDNYEIILYAATAGAGTDANPYTLTGCVRGLARSGVSLSAGTGKAHGRVEIGCVDLHYFTALLKDHVDDIQVMPQVASTSALPTSANTQYDVRFVQNVASFYYWPLSSSTGATSDWVLITSGGTTSPATETVNGISMAGDFTLAEQTTGGADLPIYGGTGANQSAAQSYTPPQTKKYNQIVLSVKKTGSPTDNLLVTAYTDSGGNPNAVILATTALPGSGFTTSYVDYAFTWASEQTGTQGTPYHFVIERSGSRDTSNYFQVQYNSASDAFPYGSLKKNDSGSWSASNYDLDFELRNTNPKFTTEYDQSKNHPVYVGIDIGANDTYAFSAWPAPVGYYTGMIIAFKANTVNTGACTVNVNGLGAKSLKVNQASDPANGAIIAGQWVEAIYDGTNFELIGEYSTLTTKGDIEGFSTARARLPVGTDGQYLAADSSAATGLAWKTRPGFATGQTTRAAGAGTGTTTIAHGLGVTPRLIRITAVAVATADDQALMMSWGTATSTSTESCVYGAAPTGSLGSNFAGSDSDSIIYLNNGDGSLMFDAILSTLDATNIVLNFTTNAAAGGTCNIQWEAYE